MPIGKNTLRLGVKIIIMNVKAKIANALYWGAIVFSVLNFSAMVVIGWEFIWSGQGIGSFALL